MRKYDVNEIDLSIEQVTIGNGYLFIGWRSDDIGWGTYTFQYLSATDKWVADSEHMDSEDDKDFGKKLLELFMDSVKIVG